jgi:hypothetical protein
LNCNASSPLPQTVEDKITTVVAAASQTAENDMDIDGEQQQASASVKRLKHIKDKVLTGGTAGCLGGRVIGQWVHEWLARGG